MNILDEKIRFTFRNIGAIKTESEVSLKPLTLFCGPNNSGKTWVLYSLCCFFKLAAGGKKQDRENGNRFRDLKRYLPDFFNVSDELFMESDFRAELENNGDIAEYILNSNREMPDPFLIPAERNGLHIFFRELSNRRTALLHHASQKNINIEALLKDVMFSPYARPIADYIDWLNGITSEHKTRLAKGAMQEFSKDLQKGILGGAYSLDKDGKIYFKPRQIRRGEGQQTPILSLHTTSSTVKSFFGLWYYLNYRAKKSDILMIDEPELHIHPENQRQIARLIAKLVNQGLYVVVSTHSDYFVKELNTLIMLSKDDGTLRDKHGYSADEILQADKVAAYLFDDQTIKPFSISAEDGIYATTFDEVINKLNEVSNDIYYTLQEGQ